MNKFPKLKKSINSFLTKEDGRISKENLIKTGVLLSAAAIAGLKSAEAAACYDPKSHNNHCNAMALRHDFQSENTIGTHDNGHGSHASHSSHGSHGSHSSHGSGGGGM